MNIYENRQSRWKLGSTYKAQLSPRDYQMLRLLFDLGYMSSELLRQFVAPNTSPRVFAPRLKTLTDRPNLYIRRPEQQKASYQANYSHLVYEITPKGIDALLKAGHITAEEAVWRSRFMQQKYREFWHDLNMANVVGSIRLAIDRGGVCRFVSPFAILANAPDQTKRSKHPLSVKLPDRYIVPDYLFGIAHTKDGKEEYRFFWYEHDQGTEPVERVTSAGSSLKRKLEDCDLMLADRLYDRHFFLPNLTILTVTPVQRHLDSIMAKADALAHRRQFIFKALDAAHGNDRVPKPVPHIFSEEWLRASSTPVRIDQTEGR